MRSPFLALTGLIVSSCNPRDIRSTASATASMQSASPSMSGEAVDSVVPTPSAVAPSSIPLERPLPACQAVIDWFAGCYPERAADRRLLEDGYARLTRDPREPNLNYDCLRTAEREHPCPGNAEPPRDLADPATGTPECDDLARVSRCMLVRSPGLWKTSRASLTRMEAEWRDKGAEAADACRHHLRDNRSLFIGFGCVSRFELLPHDEADRR